MLNIHYGALLLATLLIIGGYISDYEGSNPTVCKEYAEITDIIEVNYRSATIMTTKGQKSLNQGYAKDGDQICWRWGKEND